MEINADRKTGTARAITPIWPPVGGLLVVNSRSMGSTFSSEPLFGCGVIPSKWHING